MDIKSNWGVLVSNSDIQNSSKQELMDLASFWHGLIEDPEKKNPDDVLPEMREALALTEAGLEELTLVSDRS